MLSARYEQFVHWLWLELRRSPQAKCSTGPCPHRGHWCAVSRYVATSSDAALVLACTTAWMQSAQIAAVQQLVARKWARSIVQMGHTTDRIVGRFARLPKLSLLKMLFSLWFVPLGKSYASIALGSVATPHKVAIFGARGGPAACFSV
jgi:hypothetical protein